jgi:xanthine dehydrogenase accessory factor
LSAAQIQLLSSKPKRGLVPDEPRAAARLWLEQGRPVAMATVIETWGSAPVRPGGQLAIVGIDEFQGSVSGGCIEADVIAAGLDVIESRQPVTLSYGVADETAWRAGLACGGTLRIHVARLDPHSDLAFLNTLNSAVADRRPIVAAIRLADGDQQILDASTNDPEAAAAIRDERSSLSRSGETFLHVIAPQRRIVIVGATHIGQHLSAIARATAYDVKVVDPRSAFISDARFDVSHTLTEWPKDALARLGADSFTAVVTLTHVNDIDDEALVSALGSSCRYIGCLGSRRTHAKRVARLRCAGFSDQDIERIHAPIGLTIGAETAPEISVAILAEIIAEFRKGSQG